MKTLKIIAGCAFAIFMIKACQMDYTCNVVDSIPYEIRERIIAEHPECVDIDVLADFWITKGDSLVAEIAKEQELEEYWATLPEEY